MSNINIDFAGTFNKKFDPIALPEPISLSDLDNGYNYTNEYIIYKNIDGKIEWVISRLCDHANGTLQPCKDKTKAQCPLHGWKLDLKELHYTNVNIQKETLDFHIEDNFLLIKQSKACLEFPNELLSTKNSAKFSVRFLAHASLLINCNSIKFITDPWLKGPCFLHGWWHKPCPSDDAIEQLLSADFIYISHNHADHMHLETLQLLVTIKPDIPIIIPNFKSKSTERPLKNIGFTNIHSLAFNQLYQIGDDGLYVSILKSGDFRDDSGLYVNFNNKQLLATVDSSNLNQLILPTHIDLLATSYSGAASGHPWCFDHYSEEEKKNISTKRHQSVKNSVTEYIKACKPKAYMPYAGYFEESATRDEYIRINNKKISLQETQELVNNIDKDIIFIDPTLNDQIYFSEKIDIKPSPVKRETHYNQDVINSYISTAIYPSKSDFPNKIIRYFKNANFKDNLILYIVPCDDDFNYLASATSVDFSTEIPTINTYHKEADLYLNYKVPTETYRKLLLRIRAPQLWDVINNKKPWEELMIGFHCRIHRTPDVYNSDFWYHFSNVYVD